MLCNCLLSILATQDFSLVYYKYIIDQQWIPRKYSDIGLDHHSRQNASFAMKIGLLCSDLQKQYCCPFFICNIFSGSSSSATIKGASPARRSFAGSNEQDQHPHSPTHLKRGRVPTEKGKAFWHEHSKHVACVKISLNQTDKSKKKKMNEFHQRTVWNKCLTLSLI